MDQHPSRTRGIITILVAAAFIALAALGPLAGIPLLICLILYMRSHRDDMSAAGASPTLWIGLPVVGAILVLLAAIAGALMGDDSAWWPLAVGPFLIGGVMVVVSLVLMAIHEVRVRALHRAELVEPRTRGVGAGIAVTTLADLIATGESRGWAAFMIVVVTGITLAVLGAYAVLLHLTRPRGAPAVRRATALRPRTEAVSGPLACRRT